MLFVTPSTTTIDLHLFGLYFRTRTKITMTLSIKTKHIRSVGAVITP